MISWKNNIIDLEKLFKERMLYRADSLKGNIIEYNINFKDAMF